MLQKHFAHIWYGGSERSSVAQNVIQQQPLIVKKCLKLVRLVNSHLYLDEYEK